MMLLKSQLFPVLTLISSGLYSGQARNCGTHDLSEEEKESAETRLQKYMVNIGGDDALPRQQMIIDTYWHVIHDGTDGLLTQDEVDDSMNVLNQDFADSGSAFRYNLVDTTFTDNAAWFNADSYSEYYAMSQALRVGDCSTANIFSWSSDDLLGFVNYFPSEVSENCTGNYVDDGIWVNYASVPGGAIADYNQGKTLVHEIGHWMGLYHTFEGCSSPGDYVDDTPPQAEPTEGCPATAPDTCPGGERDPIHNYMDYSDDVCLTEFTPGQVDRMLAEFNAFRGSVDVITEPITTSSEPCYSPHATAMVKDMGKVAMKDLSVGDNVLTASGQYQTIYTINHFHHTKATNFLQIHTEPDGDESDNALELSPMHLVFMNGKENPIPAIDVKVGDYLQSLNNRPRKVNTIKIIKRDGLYNPITTDGTMVVDGIVTSSYTSFTGTAYLEIGGLELISIHNLLSMTIAPYRAFCMATSSLNLCNWHGEGELPIIVQLLSSFYDFWLEQNVPIQYFIIGVYVSMFSLINILLSEYGMFILAAIAGWFLIHRHKPDKNL